MTTDERLEEIDRKVQLLRLWQSVALYPPCDQKDLEIAEKLGDIIQGLHLERENILENR